MGSLASSGNTPVKQQPETVEECIKEIRRLQKKSNLLIDHLEEARSQVVKYKAANLELRNRVDAYVPQDDQDADIIMFKIVGKAIQRFRKELQAPDRQLSFKNNTDLAKEYIRVRKTDIDNILQDIVSDSQKEQVIDLLIDLGIFRQGTRPKGLFSVKDEGEGKFVSAYFIRKTAVGITEHEG